MYCLPSVLSSVLHDGFHACKPTCLLACMQVSKLAGTDFHREKAPKHCLGKMSDSQDYMPDSQDYMPA
jgi:hypothetical protein